MRLWSLHPSLLDRRALVALWREGLLARHVLDGETKGYTQHPQLIRFRSTEDPIATIDSYLHAVADEAEARGYRFDRTKLGPLLAVSTLPVLDGQLEYEWQHLKRKLEVRATAWLEELAGKAIVAHPLFVVEPGEIATWERTH